ncbi:nuclear transport factor 2 family protein [Caulobacter mirabilis]|uniref:Lumazine-binding protein n=1 Tax=Caulobacter mirabilis TaxID=69666 RepID=A0A2D2B049_9CAUL|nr:nuclear transport factor 2 family protein [Caulobacter mirabilis]ATQ43636.1 hypothetical protein CSW64_15150 [Caulobacter mirabilis]
MDPRFAELAQAMTLYFDGLHHSDIDRLGRVFHPEAQYVCATDGTLTRLGMDEYLPMVAARPSPAGRGEARADAIGSIAFAGPVTAFVQAACAIGPKRFTDFLTFIKLDGEWRIIAKVFHYDHAA